MFERRKRRGRKAREGGVEEEMKGSGGEGRINTRFEGRGWSLIVRAERRLEQRGEAGRTLPPPHAGPLNPFLGHYSFQA